GTGDCGAWVSGSAAGPLAPPPAAPRRRRRDGDGGAPSSRREERRGQTRGGGTPTGDSAATTQGGEGAPDITGRKRVSAAPGPRPASVAAPASHAAASADGCIWGTADAPRVSGSAARPNARSSQTARPPDAGGGTTTAARPRAGARSEGDKHAVEAHQLATA